MNSTLADELRAGARAEVLRWVRETFAQNRNALALADDIERHFDGDAAFEKRADGETVRRDRWESGFRKVVGIMFGATTEFEIPAVVESVRALHAKATEFGERIDHATEFRVGQWRVLYVDRIDAWRATTVDGTNTAHFYGEGAAMRAYDFALERDAEIVRVRAAKARTEKAGAT